MQFLVSIETEGYSKESVSGLSRESVLQYAMIYDMHPVAILTDGRMAVIEERDLSEPSHVVTFFNREGELVVQTKYVDAIFRVLQNGVMEGRSEDSVLIDAEESMVVSYLPLGVQFTNINESEWVVNVLSVPNFTQEEIESLEEEYFDRHEVIEICYDNTQGTDLKFKAPVYLFSEM